MPIKPIRKEKLKLVLKGSENKLFSMPIHIGRIVGTRCRVYTPSSLADFFLFFICHSDYVLHQILTGIKFKSIIFAFVECFNNCFNLGHHHWPLYTLHWEKNKSSREKDTLTSMNFTFTFDDVDGEKDGEGHAKEEYLHFCWRCFPFDSFAVMKVMCLLAPITYFWFRTTRHQ